MSELDWDDPNYVEAPTKYSHTSYEGDYSRDARYDRQRNGGGGGGFRKREHESSSGYGDRRRSQYESGLEQGFKETIGISAEMIGRIIGRGGSNISRIQSEYNVRIKVDKVELIVKVSGEQQLDVSNASKQLRKQIEGGDRERRYNERASCDNKASYVGGGGGGVGGEGNKYDYVPAAPAVIPEGGDLTGIIDWQALNRASVTARAARWAKYPPLTKDFYQEAEEVANLTPAQVERIRSENNKTSVSHVFEDKQAEDLPLIPNPVWKFEQCFAPYPDLLQEIQKQGFTKPSPIQSQAWPILLKGHDMIGIAQTGTGKTLAFLLPGMIHTEYQSTPRGTRGGANVLVLAPTRELALQIEMEVNKYSFRQMRAVCVYGGGDRKMQISDVERGAEIIICTPGRLNDLVQAKVIDISTITYLVLDEADRMLDMGFEPQIRKILLDIRPDRQTIMTSATWPPGVRRLAQSYMKDPIQVCVGSLDLAATHSVKQVIEILEDDQDKYNTLKSFVRHMTKTDKIIVFCGRKARADDVSSDLTLDGFSTQSIHGNRDQSDREQAIADIKSGLVRILIATDVASRGLDIEDITHVINYDFPRNIEEYVHRVGRTGRAGRKGTSISYVTREDWGMAQELINILQEAKQEVPEQLRLMAQRFAAMKERRAGERASAGGRGFGGGRRDRWY
ncbi:hypothetical protein KR222_005325 [Zaprionus bogoriensis]|nr:hypothetical protein KR222_005325 [Zaprionus bogoriensis]